MAWNASFNAKTKIQKYPIIMPFVSRTKALVISGNGNFSNWMVKLRIPCHSMKVSPKSQIFYLNREVKLKITLNFSHMSR